MINMRKLKMVIGMIVLALVLGITSSAYATEIQPIDSTNTANTATNNPITITDSSTNEVPTVGDVNTVEEPPVVENEVPEPTETIPDTGKEDTALVLLIVVVAISALYTYSRVKKYNF